MARRKAWKPIPLDSLERKVSPLDYQMDPPVKNQSKREARLKQFWIKDIDS
jgi:hypothetical protein